jgi:pSer/pThr/pTyr-binding forkhead associated (FHA) protein
MQCPICQHWNEVGARFCEECGNELPKEGAEPHQVSVRPSQPIDPAITPPPPADQPLVPITEPEPVIYAGPRLVLSGSGSIFKLSDAVVIGREDPTLQIDFDGYPDGKYISQRHAQIVKMNDKYYVEDLGSSNGTWVNDIRLAQGQSEPIEDSDVIKLGKIELTFHAK